jgi:hypothetical protein
MCSIGGKGNFTGIVGGCVMVVLVIVLMNYQVN